MVFLDVWELVCNSLELERQVLNTGNDSRRLEHRGHRPIRPDWVIGALDEGFVLYGRGVFPSLSLD